MAFDRDKDREKQPDRRDSAGPIERWARGQRASRRHAAGDWPHIFSHLPFGFWAPPETGLARQGTDSHRTFNPEIESFQRGDEFVVRADLPGLERKDITVEVRDDALMIQGERSNEHEHEEDGRYWTERSYGQFCRVVPLPEGAIADSVKASFANGVLEVVTKAPPHEVSRGRRIDIADRTREQ
jgi:HSP20 family molecular chaperone IbpA